MVKLPQFRSGRPLLGEVTADSLNAMVAAIRENRPVAGAGVWVQQQNDGVRINASGGKGRPGAGVAPLAWDIYIEKTIGNDSGDEESKKDKTYVLKVLPGTISRILPTNWESEFQAKGTELFYGIAKVTTDGTYITGVTLDITDKEPEAQQATEWGLPENVDILFGLFKDGESYNLTGGQNIDVYGKNVIITSAAGKDAEVGSPAFTLWFKLQ